VKQLSEKLALNRQRRFVGRQLELARFRMALAADDPPFVVLHIYGPGGVGKTTLLYELARLAVEHGRSVIHLDGRYLEPNPSAVALTAQQAIHAATKPVLLIDTYELLSSVDDWLRSTFLPQLPVGTLIVIAGRQAPTAWLEDSGWADLTQIISLENLSPEDGQAYLMARDVPTEQHAAILKFTHGHPLALSLVAELYRQRTTTAATVVTAAQDILRSLTERFVQDAPTAQHRQALELCVIARTTTEALLATYFDPETAYTLFHWLRQLSFIEQGPYGLFPHDLVREVLDADLHWRNPTRYAELQQAALTYLRQEVQQTSGLERQRLRMDIIYVNRRAPGMQKFFVWNAADTAYAEPATPGDFPAIIAMVQRHEGAASAAIARHWQQRQPEAFLVYRTTSGELYGFMTQLALHQATTEDATIDPAVAAALRYGETHHPIQPGEAISHLRFWMAQESYQVISPAVNITAANCVIHWTTTAHLVWSFVTMSDPEFMAPHFESIHFRRTPDADFIVGGQRYGVFSHNWAQAPVATWQIDTKHADTGLLLSATNPPSPRVVLTEADFAAAVRQALRDYTRLDQLATNPLLHTTLFATRERTPAALQALLCEAVMGLSHNPKDLKLHRALWHTYIEPAPTQEKAAEWLDLPFNTYRYHLAGGLERLIASLWRWSQSEAA
jgi:hypothetical protein